MARISKANVKKEAVQEAAAEPGLDAASEEALNSKPEKEEPTLEEVEEPNPNAAAPTSSPQTSASKEVATSQSGQTNVMAAAAEEGFEGLELGYGSFETIRLDSGEFIKTDKSPIGTVFNFTPVQSRVLHVYAQDEEGGDIVYSYDGVLTTAGDQLQEILDEWASDEIPVKITDRLEVTAQMLDTDMAGDLVLLSLPPTGRKRMSGLLAAAKMRGMDLHTLQIEASIGPPIRIGNNSFRPWVLKIAS